MTPFRRKDMAWVTGGGGLYKGRMFKEYYAFNHQNIVLQKGGAIQKGGAL